MARRVICSRWFGAKQCKRRLVPTRKQDY
jgi:hypothetical protein